MKIVLSKNNIPIRITDERIIHIRNSHPEMVGEENKFSETIENPVLILEGDFANCWRQNSIQKLRI